MLCLLRLGASRDADDSLILGSGIRSERSERSGMQPADWNAAVSVDLDACAGRAKGAGTPRPAPGKPGSRLGRGGGEPDTLRGPFTALSDTGGGTPEERLPTPGRPPKKRVSGGSAPATGTVAVHVAARWPELAEQMNR